MKYTIDYFINKFEAIPDDKWNVGDYFDGHGAFCALGHCGETNAGVTLESLALKELIDDTDGINDGLSEYNAFPTPKARILAALRDKKEGKI